MKTLDTLSVAVTADTSAFTTSIANADRLAKNFGNSITSSFAGAVVTGRSLSDTINGLGLRLSSMALNAALKPVSNSISSVVGGLFNSIGSIGTQAVGQPLNILPFAKGGVVSTPSYFPMNGATGLMGERGAEAIMPLSRGPDGRLGIATQAGGRAASVVVNISTPDAQSFRRSEADVSAAIARAVARGQRNL